MNKIVAGLIFGAILGAIDGATSWFTPEVRPMITGILVGSSIKGVIVGVLSGWFARKVDSVAWGIVWRLAAGSVPATVLTLLVLSRLGKKLDAAHGLITSVLGVALILTAIAILFRQEIIKFFANRMGKENPRRTTILTIILGAVLGVLVSVSSVGAGALGMTVLLVLYPKLPVAKLVGSDIAHAVPLTLLAGLGHWMMGSVDFHLLVSLLTGSIPGIIIGSLLASKASDRILRPILASTLALVGGKLFF